MFRLAEVAIIRLQRKEIKKRKFSCCNLQRDIFNFTVGINIYIYIYIYIYRVSQEEMSIFWEVIVSVILSKNLCVKMFPIPNGFRDRVI